MLRSMVFLGLFVLALFACTGDCLKCHPVLKESINSEHHKLLKTCIECHTTVPEGMTECGGDCFACHSQNKLIQSQRKEHQGLASCKECHVNKNELQLIDQSSNLLDVLNQR